MLLQRFIAQDAGEAHEYISSKRLQSRGRKSALGTWHLALGTWHLALSNFSTRRRAKC